MQPVKGMNDFYPQEKALQNKVFSILRARAQAYGFQEIETPAIEALNVLTAKSGEEKKQQIFVLEKRGNEQLGLRFDLTVPIARMFVQKQKELQKPVKWFGLSRMWRYEAPQKGREREFYQLSVELYGAQSYRADAECILLLIDCFTALGLKAKDVVIRINNRKLLEGLLTEYVPQTKMQDCFRIIDKSSKLTPEEFIKELKGIGIQSEEVAKIAQTKGTIQEVNEAIKNCAMTEEGKQALETIKQMTALLPKEWITIDLGIARGIDYYTGMVYEAFDREEKLRALAGGGRYDALVELYGGEKTAAVGWAIGYSTLLLFLQEKNLTPKILNEIDCYIAPVDESMIAEAFRIATELRKNANVEIDLAERKLSKQFEYASAIGAKKVIVIGSKDLQDGKVTIRDMKTGKEEKAPVTKISDFLH
ncbi:histidine--tRNA ligase [Candidatus Woesearchaeota archaeon]|nr:histidine--tRNA ligase [Candidatus Woesearchaeota archaeon]